MFPPQVIALVMVAIGVYARMMKHAGKWSFIDIIYSGKSVENWENSIQIFVVPDLIKECKYSTWKYTYF